MLEGFARRRIATDGPTINAAVGGQGPPLLLLHGYPQTHAMWHRVAPRLAADFTVVCADLPGYGDSDAPTSDAEHRPYDKRAMAANMVAAMRALGFERFGVAGHDRGARVAYRLALDHPARVGRLAVLDIIPTHAVFATVDKEVATGTFHWFFLIQPDDLPERLIGGDPAYFLKTLLARWSGSGLSPFSDEALGEYVRCFSRAATIHATCEDYRAGATIDFDLDAADRGRRMIACPTLVLHGGANQRLSGRRDVLAVWREWASDVRGHAIACGHFLAEEAPDETYAALREFFLATDQGTTS
jgi:haloacetate dehalogenase